MTQASPPPDDHGDRHRDRMAKRSRESHSEVAEVGPLPEIVNPERREACRVDLHKFLVEYFPETTGLSPLSEDHIVAIGRLQDVIINGGRFAECVYRGWAKTTIAENSCIWAGLYGYRRFIPLVGFDKDSARENLDSIKIELTNNDRLLEDFPEVCHPVRALEGKHQRCASQTIGGDLTGIIWTMSEIVFPTIPGSVSSGFCIRPTSLLSCKRGMKHKTLDGRQVRPDFVFMDDVQDDASAVSPSQTTKRINKFLKTVLRLSGHTASLAIFIAGTVITPYCFMSQISDAEQHPSINAMRVKMVKDWSKVHETLWLGQYAEIRNTFIRADPDDRKRARREATAFYRENRAAMDDGCDVAWDQCYERGEELSAIQHAYNILIDDGPEVFAAECQNDPLAAFAGSVQVDRSGLERIIGSLPRGVVPSWSQRVTTFTDIQGGILWFMVVAWGDTMRGAIIDYGSFPDQHRSYFTKSSARFAYTDKGSEGGFESQLYAALQTHSDRVMGAGYPQDGSAGANRQVDLGMIDINWPDSTDTGYRYINESQYRSRLRGSRGNGSGKRAVAPVSAWKKRDGDVKKWHLIERYRDNHKSREVSYETDRYKTVAMNRLNTPAGGASTIEVFKDTPANHRMLLDHLTSEYSTDGEWAAKPNQDNDLWDCLVGCAAGAVLSGISPPGLEPARKRKKRKSKRERLQYLNK